ncbi:MAG: hypothetical protein DBX92_14390 [Dielma fastidiosa]|jgi:phage repressor protein C with HTH and peptisase S24 domain|nr:MAG: hypothetical protein DBX92_14390 [Dielma fastidiosa]
MCQDKIIKILDVFVLTIQDFKLLYRYRERGNLMGIGKRIKEARESVGITQAQLAKNIGVTPSAITNYENETSHPKESILYSLMNALNVDANFLFQDSINKVSTNLSMAEQEHIKKYRSLDNRGRELVDMVLDKEYRYATESPREFLMLEEAPYRPRYERLASAGTGQYVFDDIPPEMVQIPEEFIDSDFVIGVNGDSMEPTYHDYDDLIVKKQLKVNDGEIGIFMIDGEAFVKEFRGDRLHSHNPEYDDIMLNEYMDIRCIGKVIGKR